MLKVIASAISLTITIRLRCSDCSSTVRRPSVAVCSRAHWRTAAANSALGVKRIGPTDEQLRSLEAYINRLILGFEQMERLAAYIQDWADNFSESLFDEELWIQYLIECNYTRDHIEDLIMNGE